MTVWEIRQSDCRELLREVEPASVSLTVTSPPYAQGKEYEKGLDYDGLWVLMSEVAKAALPATKPGGFFFVNFGETTKYPRTMAELYNAVFPEAGWIMHSRRIWHKEFSACGFGAAQTIHGFPVGEWEYIWTFEAPPRQRIKLRHNASYHGVWKTAGRCDTEHPCEFPIALPALAIQVWTDPGDLVLDCFMGSGSTGVAAVNLGRRFLGIEIDPHWCEIARRRISQAQPPLVIA